MTQNTIPPGYDELIALDQWVSGDLETRQGKTTKIPYIPSLNGEKEKAKAGDPATFRSYRLAREAHDAGRFDLIGFEFLEEDPYFFVDLDKQRDPETGRITTRARAIVALLDSLTEPSVSGTGLHIIARGNIPRDLLGAGRLGKAGDFEVYFGNRFAVMTFDPLRHYETIRDVDEATMRLLWGLLFPDDAAKQEARPTPQPPSRPVTGDDAALLERAFAAQGGEEFRRRHHGGSLLDDKSADDYGYLGALRFWTQADPARMRRIALASGRVREKWHTRRGNGDWLDYSIGSVCDEGGETYDPGRYHFSLPNAPQGESAGEYPRLLAERDALIAALQGDIRRLGDEVRRLTTRNAELETENAALEAAIKHPDQTASAASLDLIEEANRAFASGAVLTQDGKDYARVTYTKASNRRSPKTLSRGFATLCEAGTLDAFTRPEQIETPKFKGNVEIAYIHIPPELRGQRGKAVLSILPPPTGEKKHGGRRVIPVPAEVAAQANPVRRKREHVTRWYDALTDQPITVETAHQGTDYWTATGAQLTFEEVERQRVAEGYEPPRAPAYRPGAPQQPLRMHRDEAPPRQDADIGTYVLSRQDAEAFASLHQAPPGTCNAPSCAGGVEIGGYCAQHFAAHRQRHAATWSEAYAAGDD